MDRDRGGFGPDGTVPFGSDFLEVLVTIHPELRSRDELLEAAYRLTAVAELATTQELDEMDPDRGRLLPSRVLAELGRMLVERWRPVLVRYLWDLVVEADPPEREAAGLLAKLRRWDEDQGDWGDQPEAALACFVIELQAVARVDLGKGWWKLTRPE